MLRHLLSRRIVPTHPRAGAGRCEQALDDRFLEGKHKQPPSDQGTTLDRSRLCVLDAITPEPRYVCDEGWIFAPLCLCMCPV